MYIPVNITLRCSSKLVWFLADIASNFSLTFNYISKPHRTPLINNRLTAQDPCIHSSHIRHLKKKCTIVMWDVMSGDYDIRQKPEKISRRLQKYVKPGSFVVMHDFQPPNRIIPCYSDFFSFLRELRFKFDRIL